MGAQQLNGWSGMRGIAAVPTYVVMQPTTLCNLDCSYCYLPFRATDRRMSVAVAEAVAATVNRWAAEVPRFSVLWHGGEPLAAGRAHLADLMAPFVGVEHHIQTNATLIDDAWCEFFLAFHEVRIGPQYRWSAPPATAARVHCAVASPAYDRIPRGYQPRCAVTGSVLRRPVCGVRDPGPGIAAELYNFFLDLGATVLGVNVEEQEGVNRRLQRPRRRRRSAPSGPN